MELIALCQVILLAIIIATLTSAAKDQQQQNKILETLLEQIRDARQQEYRLAVQLPQDEVMHEKFNCMISELKKLTGESYS